MEYFKQIKKSVATVKEGMKLTLEHLMDAKTQRAPVGIQDEHYFDWDKGISTLQYPSESLPVPDNGRYRLHNEIDDCIVCDKCAKVCPVNCIDIEPVRAVEDMGKTSDGTPKRIHAARFDIDMAKCCFCGLCTTVCPTECLTMTKVYDFSEFDVEDHNYAFAEMTPLEILEKKQAFEAYQKEKEASRQSSGAANKPVVAHPKPSGISQEGSSSDAQPKKPAFKPRVPQAKKPLVKKPEGQKSEEAPRAAKPVFKPRVKPVVKKADSTPSAESTAETTGKSPVKPVIKPKVKPVVKKVEPTASGDQEKKTVKPVIKPKVKPVMKKPVIKPVIKKKEDEEGNHDKPGSES